MRGVCPALHMDLYTDHCIHTASPLVQRSEADTFTAHSRTMHRTE